MNRQSLTLLERAKVNICRSVIRQTSGLVYKLVQIILYFKTGVEITHST